MNKMRRPTAAWERAAAETALSRYKETCQEQQARIDQCIDNTARRREARRERIESLRQQLDLLDSELDNLEEHHDQQHGARAQERNDTQQDVIKLFEARMVDMPGAPVANEITMTADSQTPASTPANAPPANPATTSPQQDWSDLHLSFVCQASDLPPLDGLATADELLAIGILRSLFAAIPFGGQLPAAKFSHVGVCPRFIHSIVGDKIWRACWDDRQAGITPDHVFPFRLMNVVQHALGLATAPPTDELRRDGVDRYAAIVKDATSRMDRGDPY